MQYNVDMGVCLNAVVPNEGPTIIGRQGGRGGRGLGGETAARGASRPAAPVCCINRGSPNRSVYTDAAGPAAAAEAALWPLIIIIIIEAAV